VYYDVKFFMYDWIRGWVKVVTMLPTGDFDKMEPFMPHTKLASPIDIELGPDGKIYILEYGHGWFSKNPDAAIFRIDYNGGELASQRIGKTITAKKSPADTVYKDIDKANGELGHKEATDTPKGEALILASDCQACHATDKK